MLQIAVALAAVGLLSLGVWIIGWVAFAAGNAGYRRYVSYRLERMTAGIAEADL